MEKTSSSINLENDNYLFFNIGYFSVGYIKFFKLKYDI